MMAETKQYRLLTINPGSTSTKVAIFMDDRCIMEHVVRHPKEDLIQFNNIAEQKDLRKRVVLDLLKEKGEDIRLLDAIVGRGGLIKPLEGGTYTVNENMLRDLQSTAFTQHASSLGGILAHEIGMEVGVPSFVVDPIVVDEMDPLAKITGFPNIERKSRFHALNHKAVARRCAKELNQDYENCRFIVAHMGGGITVGAHKYGRIIDVNDGLDGDGPFSPERAGGLPTGQLVHMCFSGTYTEKDVIDTILKKGGMLAHLGTNDVREAERMILSGDKNAALVLEAMAYQISKQIGAMACALSGEVDAIILTGGIAYDNRFIGWIKERVRFIAPIKVYPGEDEMRALAEGALRVLRGEERPLDY